MKTSSKVGNAAIAKEPAQKGSAGNQRKTVSGIGNGGPGNVSNTVKLLSSNAPSKAGAVTGTNRSNSISRRSGASNSSMAVNNMGNESAN